MIWNPRWNNSLLAWSLVVPLMACGSDTPDDDGTTATPQPTQPAGGTPTDVPPPTDAPPPTDVPPPTDAPPTDPPPPTPTDPPPPTPTDPPPPTPTPPPVKSFYVARTFPDSRAFAVPLGAGFRVEFNEPLPQGVNPTTDITVTFQSAGGTLTGLYVSSVEGGTGANYSVNLTANTDYNFTVKLGPNVPAKKDTYTGSFSTKTPCGVAVQVGGDILEITKFGSAGRAGLQSLNQGLDSVPQLLMAVMDGVSPTDTLPIEGANSFVTALGPYTPTSGGSGSYDAAVGMPGSWSACTIGSGGNLYCQSPLVLVPLNVGSQQKSTLAYLYLRNVVVTGQVVTGANWDVNSLKMSGIASQSDVEAFIATSGPVVGGAVQSVAGTSYDTVYGDEPALSVEITTEPLPFAVNGCTP